MFNKISDWIIIIDWALAIILVFVIAYIVALKIHKFLSKKSCGKRLTDEEAERQLSEMRENETAFDDKDGIISKHLKNIFSIIAIGFFLFFSAPAFASPVVGGYWELNSDNRASFELVGSEYVSTWNLNLNNSCENSVLVVSASHYGVGTSLVHWNGSPVSLATSTPLVASIKGFALYVKTNPDIGNFELETLQTIGFENQASVILVCGANQGLYDFEMVDIGTTADSVVNIPQSSLLLSLASSNVYLITGSSDTLLGNNLVSATNYQISSAYSTHSTADATYSLHYYPADYGEWLGWLILTEAGGVDYSSTWKLGNDYFIPQNILCGVDGYCTMNFGYSIGVFSRSITSLTETDLPNYPRFRWYWNSTSTEAIVSSTIRYFIDVGQTARVVEFAFPYPTSTPSTYYLQIQDPTVYPVNQEFPVNVYSFSTSTPNTPAWCDITTMCPTAPAVLTLEGAKCITKMAFCIAFMPLPEAKTYIATQFYGMFDSAPLSIVGTIFDDLTMASESTSTITAGALAVPFVNTSTGKYYTQSFDMTPTSSFSEIMTKIKYIEAGLMWLATIAIIILMITLKI